MLNNIVSLQIKTIKWQDTLLKIFRVAFSLGRLLSTYKFLSYNMKFSPIKQMKKIRW